MHRGRLHRGLGFGPPTAPVAASIEDPPPTSTGDIVHDVPNIDSVEDIPLPPPGGDDRENGRADRHKEKPPSKKDSSKRSEEVHGH